MNPFFTNFPTITYANQTMIDISRNVSFSGNLVNNPYITSNYIIDVSKRTDQLANQFYGDPYLEWLIFMTNEIQDPYEWYLDQNQFYDYIQTKYGDYVLAQNKIKFYINNWYNQDTQTVSAFIVLDPNLQKYYTPQYDSSGVNVVQYVRKQVDWMTTTNHLVQLNFPLSNNTLNTLVNDEIINVTWNSNVSGNGQIVYTSSNQIYFQHVTGNYIPSNGINASAFSIYGQESNVTITTTSNNIPLVSVVDNLLSDELIFYDPVSYFDYENNLNESRKVISILSNTFVNQAITQKTNLVS